MDDNVYVKILSLKYLGFPVLRNVEVSATAAYQPRMRYIFYITNNDVICLPHSAAFSDSKLIDRADGM